MPAAARTTPAKIIGAARRIVERHGPEALSMQAVAQAVGIQAPSLYKRFADRAALLHAVALSVAEHLRRTVERSATTGHASSDLRAIAIAQRAFAQRSPHLYGLLFTSRDPAAELAVDDYVAMTALILDRLRRHGDPRTVLEDARLLVAYTHGFAQMESSGAFRLGGDLDEAFERGIDRILSSVKAQTKATHPAR